MNLSDNNRFRYFAPEPAAVIPPGTTMTLQLKTASELVAERKAWIAETEQCRCCGGLGRTPIAKTI